MSRLNSILRGSWAASSDGDSKMTKIDRRNMEGISGMFSRNAEGVR